MPDGFATLVGTRVTRVLFYPFERLALLVNLILQKLDLLALWDYLLLWIEFVFSSLLAFLGLRAASKVYNKGAILVTGASSTIGSDLCVSLCENGYIVFAGVRSLQGILLD
jgi:hypothetical protein